MSKYCHVHPTAKNDLFLATCIPHFFGESLNSPEVVAEKSDVDNVQIGPVPIGEHSPLPASGDDRKVNSYVMEGPTQTVWS